MPLYKNQARVAYGLGMARRVSGVDHLDIDTARKCYNNEYLLELSGGFRGRYVVYFVVGLITFGALSSLLSLALPPAPNPGTSGGSTTRRPLASQDASNSTR